MPRKYKSLIPLLEGEEFDYSNDLNLFDDGSPDARPKYFEVSTGDYDATGESPAPSVTENVQRALSCYQLRTSGSQVQVVENVKYTSGAIILKAGVYLIPGRYECRVMLPKKSNSVFTFRLSGRYTDGTRGQISISTPNNATDGDIYNNVYCYTYNNNSDPARENKVCTISKDLNDGNFHTIGWDWYYSENHKCVKFYIDNTELTTLNVAPNFPMILYVACAPYPYLSSQQGDFDYDYAEVDYIRFTAFANQTINTTGTIKEDTNRGGDIATTISDNVIIPRILKASYNGGAEVVVSKDTKDQQEIIMRNINNNDNKWTLDTNGNRNGYSYGTYSATVESKITIPSVVEATINGKKAICPVIANARAKLNKIEGNSIVWNQLMPNFKEKYGTSAAKTWFWNQDGGKFSFTEEDGEQIATLMAQDPTDSTFRMRPYRDDTDTGGQIGVRHFPQRYHKFLLKFDARAEGTDAEGWNWGNWQIYTNGRLADNLVFKNTMVPNQWTTISMIGELKNNPMVACFMNPSYSWTSGLEGKNIGYSLRRVMLFDLTLMFGTGNEPTVEEFNRMFPETYYAWTPDGEIKTTQIQSIKSYSANGTELDSINLPSEVLNKDYISSSLNSQYHNGFQVVNRLKLDEYKYDGADYWGIEEFVKVKSVDLGNYNWSKSTNNYYSFYSPDLKSAALNSDMGYTKYSCILCPVLSSTSPSNLANNTTTTNHNKAISFSGNAGGLYVYDSQYADATALKTGLTGVKAYIGMSIATQYNNDVTNYLYFEDISLQIEQDGYIEVDYTGFAPNVSFDFPVQLYQLVDTSYSKVDNVAIDTISNIEYNKPLYLSSIQGSTCKWAQYVNKSRYKETQTVSGVTLTFNKTTGSVIANGTATEDIAFVFETGDYLQLLVNPKDIFCIKGCPSGGSYNKTYWIEWVSPSHFYDIGNGRYVQIGKYDLNITDTKNLPFKISLHIKSGTTMTNKIFYPQLFNVSRIYGYGKEPANITEFKKDFPYTTYRYGLDNIISTKVNGIKIRAGYKNLLDKTKFAATQTINGVTFTNNGDGSYTLNGTASVAINFKFYDVQSQYISSNILLSSLLFQGNPAEVYQSNYSQYIRIFRYNNQETAIWDQGLGNIVQWYYGVGSVDCNITCVAGQTFNNVRWKPELVNLTDTYGAGNEPTTVAQFNQDFPDIEDIPYADKDITFDEQELRGIYYNTKPARDTLQIVKSGSNYLLQKVQKIGSVDLGTLSWRASSTVNRWVANLEYATSNYNLPSNMLTKKYITMSGYDLEITKYNKGIGAGGSGIVITITDSSYTTAEDLKTALSGEILYYELRTPVTTTLATLTKEQVTALFAKGYCIQVLGNDDNAYAVRPDIELKLPTEIEEIVETQTLDDIDASDPNIEQEDTTTENINENESSVDINETTEESTSDHID